MSVLDGLMDGKAGAAEKPAALPKADDDLISMFLDETETKEKGSDDVDSSIYPDFDAPAPEDYEGQSSPAPGGDAGGGLDGVSPDAQEAMMTLVSLPVETIVDTADITLTELIVRGCKLEDYEGKDEDKLVTSDADKAALVKATERYLDSQQIRVTPLTGLIITVLIVYGKKGMRPQGASPSLFRHSCQAGLRLSQHQPANLGVAHGRYVLHFLTVIHRLHRLVYYPMANGQHD